MVDICDNSYMATNIQEIYNVTQNERKLPYDRGDYHTVAREVALAIADTGITPENVQKLRIWLKKRIQTQHYDPILQRLRKKPTFGEKHVQRSIDALVSEYLAGVLRYFADKNIDDDDEKLIEKLDKSVDAREFFLVRMAYRLRDKLGEDFVEEDDPNIWFKDQVQVLRVRFGDLVSSFLGDRR